MCIVARNVECDELRWPIDHFNCRMFERIRNGLRAHGTNRMRKKCACIVWQVSTDAENSNTERRIIKILPEKFAISNVLYVITWFQGILSNCVITTKQTSLIFNSTSATNLIRNRKVQSTSITIPQICIYPQSCLINIYPSLLIAISFTLISIACLHYNYM